MKSHCLQIALVLVFALAVSVKSQQLDSPKECKCAPGTNGKCPENIVPVFQCKEFIKEACPTETYEEATGNGCKNCAVLRHYCATTCNFCTPTGDPSEISEQ